MAQQTINIGTVADDDTGDSARVGGDKINDNFTELYARNEFSNAEKTKLAGVEASATADQTGAEIKALYEAEADTNAYNDAAAAKLAGIETGADVTDAANVEAAGALMADSVPVAIPITCSAFGADLAVAENVASFELPYAMTLTAVPGSVHTAPTGSAVGYDVNADGSTVFSTEPTIDATEDSTSTASTPAVISTSALAAGTRITVDITAIGSTIAGTDLVIWLVGTRAA